jgi:hypothetical protein
MISFNPSNDIDLKWYQYRVYTQGQIVQSGLEYLPVNEGSYFLEGYSISNVFTVDVLDNSSATPNFDGSTTTNNVVYYAKVRSIDTSGNASAWTNIASSAATPLIKSAHIANLTAGKITSGTINAAEITLNGATSILKSSNYAQGQLGWKISGLGDAEFNNLTVRTALDIGGDDISSFHVDIDGNMWSGASIANKATAPFRVSNTGALTASSVSISGAAITGPTITGGSMTIGSGENVFKADSNGIYLGSETFASAEFRVTPAGALTATSANITGTITAISGSFTGTILSGVNNTTQFGNNINGSANYSGIKIGNTGWENAWVQRSDGSIYFNVQSRPVAPDGTARGVSRIYIDDNNALMSFNNGTFNVDYNGALTATSGRVGAFTLSNTTLTASGQDPGIGGGYTSSIELATSGQIKTTIGANTIFGNYATSVYINRADSSGGISVVGNAEDGGSNSTTLIGAYRINTRIFQHDAYTDEKGTGKFTASGTHVNFGDGDTAGYTMRIVRDNDLYGQGAANRPTLDVLVNDNNTLVAPTSSIRFKENVNNLDIDYKKILAIQPVTFYYKDTSEMGEGNERYLEYGVIAEQVEEAGVTQLVNYKDGVPFAVTYSKMSVFLLEVCRKQEEAIEQLSIKVDELESRLV